MSKCKKYFQSQKGIALLIAIFALLLLSAVGLSMMFSADAETSINSNYRDKQQVNYASLSGALEARDRLQPSNTSSPSYIPFPTDAPSTSSANIVYIINPDSTDAAGDGVKPWDPDNAYADTELCHDNVLGLSGTAGVQCTGSGSLPTGSAWYTKKDNSSSSYTGAYKLSNPLQYKWARIQLKTNDATPVTVGSGSGKIVCWDGINQIALPSGYNKNCKPVSGSVASVTVTDGGIGYNTSPNVSFSGGGGSGAAGTANISAVSTGAVSSINLTNPGSGYTSQPTVTITGDGVGATAIATISGGTVTAVNLTDAGAQCYATAPAVNISGGGGTGAQATAVLGSSTCIYSISNGACSVWKNKTYTTSATGGNSDFSADIQYKNGTGGIQSVSITNPGTGYTSAPTVLTVSGHGSCTPGSSITLGKHVASFTVTNPGSGYVSAPSVTVAPGVGTGSVPTATATVSGGGGSAGQINNIVVTNGGSGYTTATVAITGGGGTNATAIANLGTTNKVTSVTITSGGTGYTSAPTVSFSGGGCGSTCASATAYLSNGTIYGQVLQITALAVSKSGSRSITQMEVATPPQHQLGVTGALTLAGPAVDAETSFNPPLYGTPNSSNFQISGVDNNSCGAAQASNSLPAIGVYDDPVTPTNPTAQSVVQGAIPSGRESNYFGSGSSTPDIQDIYTSLGDTNSPSNFESFATSVSSVANQKLNGPVSDSALTSYGSSSSPTIIAVNGDFTANGNVNGYGILLVTGQFTAKGNFHWHGVILVIGEGIMTVSGGGGAEVDGTVILARTRDSSGNLLSTLGTPSLDWSGGGGNGIYYDHCWADNMLSKIPFNPGPTTKPLTILSTRTVSY